MCSLFFFFLFPEPPPTQISTLSLHDALPISRRVSRSPGRGTGPGRGDRPRDREMPGASCAKSEEHTSELQSRLHLVCRLLLEKKKKQNTSTKNRQSSSITALARKTLSGGRPA